MWSGYRERAQRASGSAEAAKARAKWSLFPQLCPGVQLLRGVTLIN